MFIICLTKISTKNNMYTVEAYRTIAFFTKIKKKFYVKYIFL